MRCIAIDDEPIALEVIKAHAQKVPFLQLQQTFVSATEALMYLQQQPVDLVFLDIKMPDISGAEVAKLIDKQTGIVFTTAFAEFAVQGFELAVIDYLLKPITFPRFMQACCRAQELQQKAVDSPPAVGASGYLFIKVGYDWERVNLAELLYLEAGDNYVTFYEGKRRILTRMTLTEAQEKLSARHFIKVHRSFVVAVDKIEKIERHQITIGGKPIPLSPSFKADVMQRIF